MVGQHRAAMFRQRAWPRKAAVAARRHRDRNSLGSRTRDLLLPTPAAYKLDTGLRINALTRGRGLIIQVFLWVPPLPLLPLGSPPEHMSVWGIPLSFVNHSTQQALTLLAGELKERAVS